MSLHHTNRCRPPDNTLSGAARPPPRHRRQSSIYRTPHTWPCRMFAYCNCRACCLGNCARLEVTNRAPLDLRYGVYKKQEVAHDDQANAPRFCGGTGDAAAVRSGGHRGPVQGAAARPVVQPRSTPTPGGGGGLLAGSQHPAKLRRRHQALHRLVRGATLPVPTGTSGGSETLPNGTVRQWHEDRNGPPGRRVHRRRPSPGGLCRPHKNLCSPECRGWPGPDQSPAAGTGKSPHRRRPRGDPRYRLPASEARRHGEQA